MKKYFLLYKILLLSLPGITQLSIAPGTQWVSNGTVMISLQDLNINNNGTFSAGNSTVKFSGTNANSIGGNSGLSFYQLEIAKNAGATLTLQSNIGINNSINFTSGLIDLNQNTITLSNNAILNNESESSRVIGPNGGEVMITVSLNKPNSVNAGNLGAILSSNSNLGNVTIKRGHTSQSGSGLASSINRYYNITTGGNGNQSATLRFTYFDAELNSLNENSFSLYRSTNNGTDWTDQSFTTRDANANYVEKTGLSPLSLTTLSIETPPPPPPPVTGLIFNAKRNSTSEVQLDWTSATETNMAGYEIQRKLDSELDFSVRDFVNSTAPGGNSNSPISYTYLDANSYTGTSYYRLKIVDLNNNFIYSAIKSVSGKVKGGGNPHNNSMITSNTADENGTATAKARDQFTNSLSKKITVGPNPNNGNFWFSVSGIDQETAVTLYTVDGKALKQFHVTNQKQQQVNGLSNGIYLLKVPGIEVFKVVVQGSSTQTNTTVNNSSKIKS